MAVEFCQILFPQQFIYHVIFLHIVIRDYTDWFFNTKPILHPWKQLHLVLMCDSFDGLLNSLVSSIVRILITSICDSDSLMVLSSWHLALAGNTSFCVHVVQRSTSIHSIQCPRATSPSHYSSAF